MKILIITILTSLGFMGMPDKPELQLRIQNIKNAKGTIRIAFFKKGSDFPNGNDISLAKEIKPTKTGELLLNITDLPQGDYAIAVYHDLNGNFNLDKNVFGYPTEPFGFSKNFKPRFSAPDFNDCKISIPNTGLQTSIKLID